MTEITLKPLPEPEAYIEHSRHMESGIHETELVWSKDDDLEGGLYEYTNLYTASQVEQIRRDAVRDALGAAAEACRDQRMSSFGRDPDHTTINNNAILFAIAAIRALMPKEGGK